MMITLSDFKSCMYPFVSSTRRATNDCCQFVARLAMKGLSTSKVKGQYQVAILAFSFCLDTRN